MFIAYCFVIYLVTQEPVGFQQAFVIFESSFVRDSTNKNKAMNVEQVKAEIIKMPQFAGFDWHESNPANVSAFLTVKNKCFKDADKNEYLLGGTYHLFIGHMYKGQKEKEFFYLTLCRNSSFRMFRKHRFESLEYNKIFASGRTVKEIIKSLQGGFDKGYDFV